MYFVQSRLLPDVFIFYKNESERKENEKDYYNTMYFGNELVDNVNIKFTKTDRLFFTNLDQLSKASNTSLTL